MKKVIFVLSLIMALAAAASAATLHGIVTDGVGRRISGARIGLASGGGKIVANALTASDGAWSMAAKPGHYLLEVQKPGFARASIPVTVTGNVLSIPVTLDIAPMQQTIVVAANGAPTPQTRLGQQVATIGGDELKQMNATTADEALRLEPGLDVVRSGQAGALTEVSVRGGEASFTKILVDGIPVQRFDFGGFDFSTLLADGIAEMQVVQGPDSVIYGSDAVSGVIDVRTLRGSDVLAPELSLSSEFGSFSTARSFDHLAGSWQRLDYSFLGGYFDTHNQEPNNKFRDGSLSGDVGLRINDSTGLRLISRYTRSFVGLPNAVPFYGFADDSFQRQGETYSGLELHNATNRRWQNRFTLTESSLNYFYENPSPTGIPDNGNYVGRVVTITGANGFSTTGQAILDFGGAYPIVFPSDTLQRGAGWDSDYEFAAGWKLLGGYRYYNERGLTSSEMLSRHDHGLYSEVTGSRWNRVFADAGASWDKNSVFGTTTNPQASLAILPRLSRGGMLDETRLRASGGTALRDPDLTQQESSLYQQLAAAGQPQTISALGITPIHPQRAHSFDAGVDQYFAGDRIRLSATVFRSRYYDLIEFVPSSAFPLLGISPQAANATFGAYLNSLTETARGQEWELTARPTDTWDFGVAYTYMDARVLRSFSSDALYPSFNPAFPKVPIGAYSPLVGARPFRLAPDSGSIVARYSKGRWGGEADAVFVSRRDDSTFLSDANFGTTMLLPNHDLLPAYGIGNLAGFLHLTRRVTLQGSAGNLLNRNYQEAFGYPALGLNLSGGIRVLLSKPQ
jgi:vitamin B12 transporter